MEIAVASVKRVMKNAVGTDTPISPAAVKALIEEIEKFIEETSLAAQKLSAHAGRKGISEEDIKLAFE